MKILHDDLKQDVKKGKTQDDCVEDDFKKGKKKSKQFFEKRRVSVIWKCQDVRKYIKRKERSLPYICEYV